MMKRSLLRSLALILLVLAFCVPSAAPVISSQSPRRAVSAAAPPPPEQVSVSGEEQMHRLSPDLRAAALSAAPVQQTSLLVTAMLEPGAVETVRAVLRFPAVSREVAGARWITGEIETGRLAKLAGIPGVRHVFSTSTYQTATAPGLDELRTLSPLPDLRAAARLSAAGDMASLTALLQAAAQSASPRIPGAQPPRTPSLSAASGPLTPPEIHGAAAAHALGIDGAGVTVAVIDTGVDFGHPDLTGTQATVPSGPYAGWPFAYDTLSGYYYASHDGYVVDPLDQSNHLGGTNFVATLAVESPQCADGECAAVLPFGAARFPISLRWPDTSLSGQYYYSVLPDAALIWQSYFGELGYPGGVLIPPLLVVSDEAHAGVYDAVYVDINYDGALSQAERLSKGHFSAGYDRTGDGVWDLSSGLLTWISDGVHQPPGVVQVYPESAALPLPGAGRLLVFLNDVNGHGTSCAGQIVAQSVISDPDHIGPNNPLLPGPILAGIAPAARIAAFQNGFNLPLEAWTLAALGFDGQAETGDEVQIVSNSWGSSSTIADGWDDVSRFAHDLNLSPDPQTGRPLAEQVTFLAATGNGGHGYGTVTSPDGATILNIGASTLYGGLTVFENVEPGQFLSGEIQPWSNRGPGGLGDLAPDLSAVGAWGPGPLPLNLFIDPDGQAAYDTFGGTSMSTPLAAGGAALVYQAFLQQHARWPTWSETRALLIGGARDLGYEPSVQGAGDMRADLSVQAVLNQVVRVDPAEWSPGGYHGQEYPAFARVLTAGESAAQQFTLSNPTAAPLVATLSAVRLERIHDETFTIPYTPPTGYSSSWPLYLENLDDLLLAYPADLVRAQLVMPYTVFDADGDYYEDQWWRIALYDWTDRDGDGLLWQDANRDGQVQTVELEGTAVGSYSELNRFSYAYPTGTILETSLGRSGLSQAHDGVFLGLSCTFCGNSFTLQVRVSFYRYEPWDWVDLSAGQVILLSGGQASFQASINVPASASPGYVEGMIRAEMPDRTLTVPLTAQVAASDLPFAAGPGGSAPYTNGNLQGGFNWHWRYESGDWRFFFFDIPPSAAPAGQFTRGVLDLGWDSTRTDIDAFVFGPAASPLTGAHPDQFGPTALEPLASSADALVVSGKFRRETVTGGPREVLSFDPRPGLNLLALHQVLSGGDQHAEPFSASVYTLNVSPALADWIEPLQLSPGLPPRLSGRRQFTLSASAAIPSGLSLQAYGFSPRIEFTGQVIRQDNPYETCSVSWVYRPQDGLELLGAGLLDIQTASDQPGLDIDLIVLRDDGDGRYECNQDKVAYYSGGPAADEHLRVNFPQDGVYWIGIQGFSVPSDTGLFDITIRAVQGTGIRLRGLPVGPVAAGQLIPIQVDFAQDAPSLTGAPLEGLIYAGLPSVPGLVEIPITLRPAILLYPSASLTSGATSVYDQPVPIRLTFSNAGALPESVHASITLPIGLQILPASLVGPGSLPVYNPLTRRVEWDGPLPAAGAVELTFEVIANPLTPPGPAEIKAVVDGLTSGQSTSASLILQANRQLTYFPRISR